MSEISPTLALNHSSLHTARWRWLWLGVVAWCGLIFWLSSQSHPPEPGPDFKQKDKVEHIILYSPLAALAFLVFVKGHRARLTTALVLAILIATFYGVTDEWHQSFVPNRTSDWRDVLADAGGGTLGAVVCFVMLRIRRKTP